ncbi:hypothetical protein HMN09_00000900 [Mycena chlorophos]|uniref:Uncharacterized protein n=1 Tax=Mycena chlorophos TaxID=658473 RepID=A0A8H6TT06_MYCCL|nr:hypothetical protein HMN09_00000900 [Mycena chlorophos]
MGADSRCCAGIGRTRAWNSGDSRSADLASSDHHPPMSQQERAESWLHGIAGTPGTGMHTVQQTGFRELRNPSEVEYIRAYINKDLEPLQWKKVSTSLAYKSKKPKQSAK